MDPSLQLTTLDRKFLRITSPSAPIIGCIEFVPSRDVSDRELVEAVRTALAINPRLCRRIEDDQIFLSDPSTFELHSAPTGATDAEIVSSIVDPWFDPAGPFGIRIGRTSQSIVFAWSHPATDAGGAVGFASQFVRLLSGDSAHSEAPSPSHGDIERNLNQMVRKPQVYGTLVRRTLKSKPATPEPWPATSDAPYGTGLDRRTLDKDTLSRVMARAKSRGGTITSEAIHAAAAVSRQNDPGAAPIVHISVSLRDLPGSHWQPVGNWVGSFDIEVEPSDTPAEIAETLVNKRKYEAYGPLVTARLQGLAARILRRRGGSDDPEVQGPPDRTLFIHNLGRISADMFPGLSSFWFFGNADLLTPSISLCSFNGELVIVTRACHRLGGAELAEEIGAAFAEQLIGDPASPGIPNPGEA